MVRLPLLALLACGLAAQGIPTPASHFGHPIGVDRELLDWNKVVSYFEALANSSDKIQVKELGKTADGRPFIAATISAPGTLRNLSHYLSIQQKLADPRKTTDAEAERLIDEGKTVVLITCSIHATEVASTHSAVEFAYRLLTDDKPRFRAILANTIFILVPSLNPDGVDIVTRWYRETLGTPYEGSQPPELYHKYVGHDNNRDWYVFSQPETRHTISQLHNVWHPQIVYDVHQRGPFASRIFVPPWLDPVDPNIDAIIVQQCNSIGASMAADLTAAGKKGVAINAMYDFWTASRHYQAYHGGLRILSESASARLATPQIVKPEQIQNTALGYNPREASWNYLEPWEGGTWRLRDIIDYQLIALESCLYQAAIHRPEMLRNFYTVGKRALARSSPYAFVIPKQQQDPGATRKMLELLSFGMVEIERAGTAFDAGSRHYAEGSYVIRMEQPYSSYAKTLLERQHYPDLRMYPGGPPKRPYDVTTQTLPLLMGVRADTIPHAFTVPLSRAMEYPVELSGRRPPAGALAASDVDSWRAVNRLWNSGKQVWRDTANGDFYPRQTVEGHSLVELKRPRVGLYKSYVPAMDEGWTRWLLENFGFNYSNVENPAIESGNLRHAFDVIVFPDEPPSTITEGFPRGAMPERFVGGLSGRAAGNLRTFASEGGTLVFLNHSTEFAVEALDLKVTNAVRGVANKDFYSPGSLLNVTLDTHSALAYGMPPEIAIWSEGSPAWDVAATPNAAGTGLLGNPVGNPAGNPAASQAGPQVVARYVKSGVLASGWLLGPKYLESRAALIDAPIGSGRAVLFGMRPQYRAQSYQAFKMFFNALVLGSR